ncbi:MAG: NapC/NirT family cytochrome c [Candidatus Omnitrophica bacterium]|nr:NapC/NirT family cytochrome c [Candidatus Omnitrophota bacterium]
MNLETGRDKKESSYFQNWISVIGGICSVTLFSVILFLFILDFWSKQVNPYLGVITYLIAPVFLIASLLLIPLGAWRERSRRHKRGYVRKFPHIDFNNPTHQKLAFMTIGVSTLFLLFTMFGTYHAYEFTESVTFCGVLCHQVMKPEHTAYKHSPHARVSCVECHIGSGADWFVRSKLSGTYQIYSVLFGKYHRPIETPIKNLRPAQETCEQCHWPRQFFGAVEQDHQYFLSDEANTEWQTKMLMLVGGGMPPYGKKEGIHWHMNISNDVHYIATDEKRQVIPWVKVVGADGKEEVYVSEDSGYSQAKPPSGELRRMDCMDCHNRPSHIFKSPQEAVNEALAFGALDRTLPYLKREAVRVLTKEYASHEEARGKIQGELEKFYQTKYPEVWSSKKEALEQSIHTVIDIYQTNFFPEMKVSWNVYPDNIGHLISPGCFRCHDGKHKTAEGKMIRTDCKACHVIVAQGSPPLMETNVDGLEFKHPEEIGEAWKETACSDCHTGG